jgi:hypothetical protein
MMTDTKTPRAREPVNERLIIHEQRIPAIYIDCSPAFFSWSSFDRRCALRLSSPSISSNSLSTRGPHLKFTGAAWLNSAADEWSAANKQREKEKDGERSEQKEKKKVLVPPLVLLAAA